MPLKEYLEPNYYVDSDHPEIIAFAAQHTAGIDSPKAQAIALFYAIRDGFRYNPYQVILDPKVLKASFLLSKKDGYCIEKSNLLAACARAVGIPARLGFANVRNHLATSKLEEHLGTDLLVFHGYTELWLNNKWVKATPVFDARLCAHLGVDSLDFDGENDSFFQQSDKKGQPFMDYAHYYGEFADIPFDLLVSELRKHYPHLFANPELSKKMGFDVTPL
jgi:transglutaminase-like putative cysteine protease